MIGGLGVNVVSRRILQFQTGRELTITSGQSHVLLEVIGKVEIGGDNGTRLPLPPRPLKGVSDTLPALNGVTGDVPNGHQYDTQSDGNEVHDADV